MSSKRAKLNKEYSKRRKAYLTRHPYCMAQFVIWPESMDIVNHYRATEIHHTRKPKCKYLLDESTWLAVSAIAHRWIEDHKDIAREIGLLK